MAICAHLIAAGLIVEAEVPGSRLAQLQQMCVGIWVQIALGLKSQKANVFLMVLKDLVSLMLPI